MKLMMQRLGLALSLVCLLGTVACDKNDDPDAIDTKNLKYASSLSIVDGGDGSITLYWEAANYEGDFEGYNVYGVTLSDDQITELAEKGFTEGSPLQLLDGEGEPRSESKDILQEFNYDTENPFTKKEAAPSDDGERKISFLPIHALDADSAPILPTCYPAQDSDDSTTYTCTDYTKDNVESIKDEDGSEINANGSVSYAVSGLTPGEQYCFLVFTVQDDGEEISQTSTNIECLRPAIDASVAVTGADNYSSNGSRLSFKIADYATACEGTCPDLAVSDTTYFDSGADDQSATGTNDIQIETFSGNYNFTAGIDCGIVDLGVRTGLADPSTPDPLPLFGNEYGDGDDKLNSNGYSVPGASMEILDEHLYLLGCEDADDEDKSHHHLLYVSSTSTDDSGTINLAIRASLTSISNTAE